MHHLPKLILTILMLPIGICSQAQIPLAEYRKAVETHSRLLREAEARHDEAQALTQLARVQRFPQLTASGDFSLAIRSQKGIKPWDFSFGPEILATLYGGGALQTAFRSASIESEITRETLRATHYNVRYSADYTYWNLSAMTLYRASKHRYVELIKALMEIIERRFEEGYTAKGDLLMIQAQLSTAEYELLVAEEQFEEALHNFNILRGTESDRPVELTQSILDSLPIPLRKSFAATLEARPDFEAARLRTRKAQNDIGLAAARYNPTISVGINGYWHPESPNRNGQTTLDGALFARIGIPIFGWGARRRAVGAAHAAARQAEWQEAELNESILREERNGWSALVESQARVEAMAESLRIAGENLELSTYSYREGLTTIYSVLQAQLNWIQIYTNVITAHFNLAIACSAYERITAQGEY